MEKKSWLNENAIVIAIIIGFLLFGFLVSIFTQSPPPPYSHPEKQTQSKVDNLIPTIALPGGKNYAQGQIIVKFKSGISDEIIAQHLRQYNAYIKSKNSAINMTVVSVPVGQEMYIREQLSKDPIVKYAEPDYIVSVQYVPNDPDFGNQWDLANTGQTIKGKAGIAHDDINVESAWDVTKGNGVKVAIIDTGIDMNHPDLAGKVVGQKIFTTNSIDDKFGHGTHIAGIIAADTNNGQGIAGVCPDCELLIVKAMNDSGQGLMSDLASAIIWSADNGAKVINMSEGGGQQNQAVQDAVNYAFNKGAIIAAAAGNNGSSQSFFPAGLTGVVSVASTSNTDVKSTFSNYGTWVDVAAPGENIFSTLPTHAFVMQLQENVGTNYDYLSGTSMATPVVSGVLALIYSTSYGTSPNAVIQRLYTTADKIAGTGQFWSQGRVNAGKAVASASPTSAPTNSPTSAPTEVPVTLSPGVLNPVSTMTPTSVVPTFVCGGSPNGSVCPSLSPTEAFLSSVPSVSSSVPSVLPSGLSEVSPVSTIAPSTNPCEVTATATVQAWGHWHSHHHRGGAISGVMHQFLQILLQLLQIIMGLWGGGSPGGSGNTPTGGPFPLPSGVPTINPCSSSSPSTQVQPSSAISPSSAPSADLSPTLGFLSPVPSTQ